MTHRDCWTRLVISALGLGLAGCAVDPKPDYQRAGDHISRAVGPGEVYQPGDEARVERRVGELCTEGITADEAVRICLLNNPRLQAAFFEVGIARAEVVQSRLFSNPSLALSLRFPDSGGLANFEGSLSQNIAELWQIPARGRAAERFLDRAVLQLARQVSMTALDAKAAHDAAVLADRAVEIAKENAGITRQLVDLAVARQQAGAGSVVDVNLARSELLETELELRRSMLVRIEARSDLGKLLGLNTLLDDIRLSGGSPETETNMPSAERVAEIARERRLDVQAADQAVLAARERWDLERFRVFQSVEVGVAMERGERRPTEGQDYLADTARASIAAGQLAAPEIQPRPKKETDFIIGPTLGLEVPLFDQNQARIARAEYEHEQASKLLDSILSELVQEAHVACERLRTAAENARFYRDEVLPLREVSLSLSREAYQAGKIPFLSVLESERVLLRARTGYLSVLREWSAARIGIEKVAGVPRAEIHGLSTATI
ncbi:MAG TPA: TolC family protein, partial [Phycisphaerae bacterium]|nr:TolC family protein [Phycisphaerae bacterium]